MKWLKKALTLFCALALLTGTAAAEEAKSADQLAQEYQAARLK